jgi:hypothetical protein
LPVNPVTVFGAIDQDTGIPSPPVRLKDHVGELFLGGGDRNVPLSVHQGVVNERVRITILTVHVILLSFSAAWIRHLLGDDCHLAVHVIWDISIVALIQKLLSDDCHLSVDLILFIRSRSLRWARLVVLQ